MSAGFTTGAILGGVLTDLLSWRWAFFINVPVAAAVLIIAPMVIAESRPQQRPRLDLPGALSVTLGLLAVVFGFTQAGEHGWTHLPALGALAAGVLLLIAFYFIERTSPPPGPRHRPATAHRGLGQHRRRPGLRHRNLPRLPPDPLPPASPRLLPLAAGLSFGVLGLGTVLGGTLAPASSPAPPPAPP